MKKLRIYLLFCIGFFLIGCDIEYQKIYFDKKEITIQQGDSYILKLELTNVEKSDLIYSTSMPLIIAIENDKLTGLKVGKTILTISVKDNPNVNATITVNVIINPDLVNKIIISGENNVIIGEQIKLNYTILPITALNKNIIWSSDDISIASIDDDGFVTGIKVGSTVIRATAQDLSSTFATYKITINEIESDITPPIIQIDYTITQKDVKINYNSTFDPMLGIMATDSIDGDLTHNINIEGYVDNRSYGTYTLIYTVSDHSGNQAIPLIRKITVIWDYGVTFIGHAGSYSGIMNTEEAFINAVTKHGYTAIECDLKQTKDGVFVTCHDDAFAGYTLASTNYNDLKDVEYTTTRGGISYTSKICTLERYLEICKEYNVTAVIELKYSKGINNSDTSRMQALMDLIEEKQMRENVILLGSQYLCLQWTRENGYEDIPCQYLVNSCESEIIFNRCNEWNYDISINISANNTQDWIDKYHDANIKVSAYTFNQYSNAETLQKWIDMGVDYVTCDVLKPYEVNLPNKDHGTSITYLVEFLDWNDNVLKSGHIKAGRNAVPPVNPTRPGYRFIGWDLEYRNVNENLKVKALYELDYYSINYNENLNVYTTIEWENKSSFINEFYDDFFAWFSKSINIIPSLTKVNDQYSLTFNNVTVKWTNSTELLNLDKYDVEKTIAHFIYKPFKRSDNQPSIVKEDNFYFLNSEPYRTKYQTLDAYFLNCCLTSYPGYDNSYNPTSAGKIQIFFRFHQWAKNEANIISLNELPLKTTSQRIITEEVILPTTPDLYTIEDTFVLSKPIYPTNKILFLGWYDNPECSGNAITIIQPGSYGDLILYAKWQLL